MNKYIFQYGGDNGASMMNSYLDAMLPTQETDIVQDEQPVEEYYIEDDETDFIKGLREQEENLPTEEDIFTQKISELEARVNSKLMELEDKQYELEALGSFNSEEFFRDLYDTESENVPYNPMVHTNTTPVAYTPTTSFSRDRVQRIIDKFSGGKSPLTADDFLEISSKYGVPIDLMLAQAAQESAFGTKGMAVRTRNIFNVGNNGNTGKTTTQNSFKSGLERYAHLIKTEYATNPNNVTTADILKNRFVRPRKGGQYAEDDYTERVTDVLNLINAIR